MKNTSFVDISINQRLLITTPGSLIRDNKAHSSFGATDPHLICSNGRVRSIRALSCLLPKIKARTFPIHDITGYLPSDVPAPNLISLILFSIISLPGRLRQSAQYQLRLSFVDLKSYSGISRWAQNSIIGKLSIPGNIINHSSCAAPFCFLRALTDFAVRLGATNPINSGSTLIFNGDGSETDSSWKALVLILFYVG